MLNLYLKPTEVNSFNKRFLVDLLKPLFSVKILEKYGINKEYLTIVKKPVDSDFYIIPFSWNYYCKFNKKTQAIDIIKESAKFNKKVIIWVSGDYFIKLPQYDNILAMYHSLYRSRTHGDKISLPSIINDPLKSMRLDSIQIRSNTEIPSVGFCSQIDRSLFITIIKIVRNCWYNILFFLRLSSVYSGPKYPPTTLRKNILDNIEKNELINSIIIRRNKYKGGKVKDLTYQNRVKEEYYQNICKTDYTICIRGTGNFSTRFYETLALGRIPIFVNTDCILPFEYKINWKEHVVWVEENERSEMGKKISDFHNCLNNKTFHQLQLNNRLLWENHFSFSGFINKFVSHLNQQLNS
ncbi:MAG: exostosin family protein [Candidatus Marinimicrobia bacterium]|nr:exostosin family protein [Candidatus Neomarinimicrobiota bacterium]